MLLPPWEASLWRAPQLSSLTIEPYPGSMYRCPARVQDRSPTSTTCAGFHLFFTTPPSNTLFSSGSNSSCSRSFQLLPILSVLCVLHTAPLNVQATSVYFAFQFSIAAPPGADQAVHVQHPVCGNVVCPQSHTLARWQAIHTHLYTTAQQHCTQLQRRRCSCASMPEHPGPLTSSFKAPDKKIDCIVPCLTTLRLLYFLPRVLNFGAHPVWHRPRQLVGAACEVLQDLHGGKRLSVGAATLTVLLVGR